MTRPAAVIFDLDGVLIQSERSTFKLLQAILRRYGYVLDDEHFPDRVGKKIKNFIVEAYPDMPVSLQDRIAQEFYEEYAEHTETYIDPIHLTVQFLKDYKGSTRFGLASVSSKEEILKILSLLGLSTRFDKILSSDDITHVKSHPEIYQRAAQTMGIDAQKNVVIEDSAVGAAAAVAAGFQTYVLLNGLNTKQDFADIPVNGFIESVEQLGAVVSVDEP